MHPYEKYPLQFIGIPGNHDGAPLNASATSLEGFYRNFLATPNADGTPVVTTESGDSGRPAMHQPFFYWTLTTPFATFIGLYTNVPEHGLLDADQRAWFQQQMASADRTKALVVALHHPIFSFDTFHSGSPTMAQELQDAINSSGRLPNLVLTAHVHNYQRIELVLAGHTIPFFVIGNGGYHNMHQLSAAPGYKDPETLAELVAAIDTSFGFMTFDISATTINGHFTTVPKVGGSWNDPTAYNPSFDVFNYTAAPPLRSTRRNGDSGAGQWQQRPPANRRDTQAQTETQPARRNPHRCPRCPRCTHGAEGSGILKARGSAPGPRQGVPPWTGTVLRQDRSGGIGVYADPAWVQGAEPPWPFNAPESSPPAPATGRSGSNVVAGSRSVPCRPRRR